MATDTRLGFHFMFRIGGGQPTIQDLLFKDTETLTKGDLVNLESGEVDLAATGDTNLLGAVKETIAGTDSTTKIKVYTDPDAVYSVYDANARVKGATLDIAGATGAMTVAASSNKELVVYADSAAGEQTLVRFNVGKHHESVAL
jgi:hypothetical protein